MMSILQLRKNHSHDESMIAAIVVIEKGRSSEPTSIETLLPLHEHHDAKQGQIMDLSPPEETKTRLDIEEGRQKQTTEATPVHTEISSRRMKRRVSRKRQPHQFQEKQRVHIS